MLAPDGIAGRSCDDCAKYHYDDSPRNFGRLTYEASGKPRLRLPTVPTPCGRCPKIPAGDPPVRASAVELGDDNWRALAHYRRCRAVGRFPEDWIVERNAAVIRGIEDEAERRQRRKDGMDAAFETVKLLKMVM